jgi:hypothetical protein
MKWLVAVFVVLAASRAEAMGSYVNFEVLAWSTDGSSALLSRVATSSAESGAVIDRIIVTAGDPKPLVFTIADAREEPIAEKQIAINRRALERAMSARGFCGAPHAPRCHVESDRERIEREAALRNIDREAVGPLPDDAELATLTGRLVIVLEGKNGDESGPAHAHVFSHVGLRWDAPFDLRYATRLGEG